MNRTVGNINIEYKHFEKGGTVNYPKNPVFSKEQNAGFSTQIHRVTLTKSWFFKKRHDMCLKRSKKEY